MYSSTSSLTLYMQYSDYHTMIYFSRWVLMWLNSQAVLCVYVHARTRCCLATQFGFRAHNAIRCLCIRSLAFLVALCNYSLLNLLTTAAAGLQPGQYSYITTLWLKQHKLFVLQCSYSGLNKSTDFGSSWLHT